MPNAKTYEPDENQKMCETKAEKASWSWVVLARSNHTLITRWRGLSRCLRSWAGHVLRRCMENAVECNAIYLQHACVSTVKACDRPGGLGKAQHSNVSSKIHWHPFWQPCLFENPTTPFSITTPIWKSTGAYFNNPTTPVSTTQPPLFQQPNHLYLTTTPVWKPNHTLFNNYQLDEPRPFPHHPHPFPLLSI